MKIIYSRSTQLALRCPARPRMGQHIEEIPMVSRRHKRLLKAAAPMLEPDESVEIIVLGRLGSLAAAVKKSAAASVAFGVTVAALSGGYGYVNIGQRQAYLILTDRQLLLFECIQQTGGPGRHLGTYSRESVSVSDLKDGSLFTKFLLHVNGMEPIKLTVPPYPPSGRGYGRALAAALSTTAQESSDQRV